MDGLWRPTNLRESCYAYSCHSRLTLASGATALDSVVLSRLQREEIIWDWIRGWRAKRLPPATFSHAAGVKREITGLENPLAPAIRRLLRASPERSPGLLAENVRARRWSDVGRRRTGSQR